MTVSKEVKMLRRNQKVTIDITGMTAEGSGVGRHEGFAVFVPDTAVGDTAEVKIVKVLKSYAFGRLEQLLTPSADRIKPTCATSSQCGGCVFRHISYEAELKLKDGFVREAFTRIGGLTPEFEPVLASPEIDGYRNKAQFPVGMQDKEAVCGFYAKRSHRIVPSEGCALSPPEFDAVLRDTMAYLRENDIQPYDEKTHTGLVRHIFLRRGHYSKEMQVCIVAKNRCDRLFEPLAAQLVDKYAFIKSVVLNINSQKTNVIMGKQCVTLRGSDTISDRLCGIQVSLSPLSFYQVNTPQAECLYSIAADYAQLSGTQTVLDLYCGTGTIGLSMADSAAQIIGVESVQQAIEDARFNAMQNGITNARFICADAAVAAEQLASEGISPDVVVLDPPRKGCEIAVLDTVAQMRPSRIVMISCNPATAARDCAIFARGGYEPVKVRAVDMFPRTGHVECVVLMESNNKI